MCKCYHWLLFSVIYNFVFGFLFVSLWHKNKCVSRGVLYICKIYIYVETMYVNVLMLMMWPEKMSFSCSFFFFVFFYSQFWNANFLEITFCRAKILFTKFKVYIILSIFPMVWVPANGFFLLNAFGKKLLKNSHSLALRWYVVEENVQIVHSLVTSTLITFQRTSIFYTVYDGKN